jgi:hypothetical protein
MTDEAVSPLRRRMIEDMTIRKFAPKTQHDYVQRVKNIRATKLLRKHPGQRFNPGFRRRIDAVRRESCYRKKPLGLDLRIPRPCLS